MVKVLDNKDGYTVQYIILSIILHHTYIPYIIFHLNDKCQIARKKRQGSSSAINCCMHLCLSLSLSLAMTERRRKINPRGVLTHQGQVMGPHPTVVFTGKMLSTNRSFKKPSIQLRTSILAPWYHRFVHILSHECPRKKQQ